MRNIEELIKLSKYYLEKYSSNETKPVEVNTQDKTMDFLANLDQQKILDALAASYRLGHVTQLISGSELAFNLHEQQRKTFKEFTPQHSKSIEILAKINENLKTLRQEEAILLNTINNFQNVYKKHLNINEIER